MGESRAHKDSSLLQFKMATLKKAARRQSATPGLDLSRLQSYAHELKGSGKEPSSRRKEWGMDRRQLMDVVQHLKDKGYK